MLKHPWRIVSFLMIVIGVIVWFYPFFDPRTPVLIVPYYFLAGVVNVILGIMHWKIVGVKI